MAEFPVASTSAAVYENGFHSPPASAVPPLLRSASPPPPDLSAAALVVNDDQASTTRTGWCYNTTMMLHRPIDTSDDHPESPNRILEIYRRMKANGLIERMRRIATREACLEEIRLVHTEDQWKRIEETAAYPTEHLDAIQSYYNRQSLYINEKTALCARLSCGSVIDMCRAVAEGRIRNGFAIVRPPGHHAEPDMEMGFCIYNNAAVAAAWLRVAMPERIKRVLILDWDVHHGNGTQKAFYDNPDVLYISLHRYDNGDFYPGGDYGAADKCGEEDGLGRNVNIPWLKAGMGDADYIYAFQQIVMPIALEFNPDFVIVSAGFDAAKGDDLGQCNVTPAGFAHMTHLLASVADGRCVLALEGGYNIDAIAQSAVACTQTLLGELPPRLEGMTASSAATEVVAIVSREQSRFWKSIRPMRERKEDYPDEALTLSLTDVLKLHRSHYVYETYKLINVNLASNGEPEGKRLARLYDHQVFCSDNVYTADTLVVYLHDMGTIHAELGAEKTEANLERSFLVDNTKLILDWVVDRKFAIIDVNVLPHREHGETQDAASQKPLALHLWDCFCDLAQASSIVFIGQGAGCAVVGHILENRDVMARVKVAVQICGLQRPPEMPRSERAPGLRLWYYGISIVICPKTHELLDDHYSGHKRFGKLYDSGESHPSKVVTSSWPKIRHHLEEHLGLLDAAPVISPLPPMARSNGLVTSGSAALDGMDLDRPVDLTAMDVAVLEALAQGDEPMASNGDDLAHETSLNAL